MATPDSNGPAPVPAPATATATAPAPVAPAAPAEGAAIPQPARPKVPRFDPKRSFEGTSAVDRLKEYLKKIPVYDAQIRDILRGLMQALAETGSAKERFDQVTAEIKATVGRWEEEQRHARPEQPVAGAAPGPGAGEPGGPKAP